MNDIEHTDSQRPAPLKAFGSETPITQFTSTKGQRPFTALLGAVLAIPAPLFGLLFSILALQKIRQHNLDGEKLANFGKIMSIISLSISVGVVGFLLFLGMSFFGLGHKNQAAEDLTPLMNEVTRLGGKEICNNGDSGYGIDNRQPWYDVYYKITDNSNLSNQLTDTARKMNFNLSTNDNLIHSLKGEPGSDGYISHPYGDQQFSPLSNYLVDEKDNKKLSVTIHRDETVNLYCSTNYGATAPAISGQAIIHLYLSLPQRDK